MDLSTFSTLLGSIKTATDIAKFIKDSDLTIEKAESKLKFAELISALADAKIEISDIQQAIIDKDNEIRSLKSEAALQASLTWDTPYYWRIEVGKKDGPYCQPCFDKDKRLVRLTSNYCGLWDCRVCHQQFQDRNYRSLSSQNSGDYDPFKEF